MALNRTHEEWEKEAHKLMETNSKNPFTVPDGYFASLSTSIESAIFAEQLKDEVKSDGYTVPANYFTTLEERINNRIHLERPVEHKIPIKRLSSTFVKYAAAACILLGVSLGVLVVNKNNSMVKQLHGIPENDIVQYLQQTSDAGDTYVIIENLDSDLDYLHFDASQQELEQYINQTSL